MSAPSRGRGGTAAARGSASTMRGRGTNRGNSNNSVRGRGRGRSSGNVVATTTNTTNNAGGLLQKLRTGTVQRSPDDSATSNTRGRGTAARGQFGSSTRSRGSVSKSFNASQSPRTTQPPRPSSPALPSSHRDFMAQMNEKFQLLKPKRDAERTKAIQDGFLADPDKKTSLANAITPVGTCTEMCPEFERVERIVQNMVERPEKVMNEATGRSMPSESRMIKRFRRSAAGYDEQLPSDIRTPETLRRTLDYLLDKIVGGGERLASVHKFVWDRTRGIRNDFSIQQVSKKEDVKIAIDCYEKIARFHIVSLHQLSNPDNLQEGEEFNAYQEREQLNNTFLSLMYYYDDNRGVIPMPNEPEFRSYCILFELQSLHPDLEDRMQTWPTELLNHPKVRTAFTLHAAAGNSIMDQGPLRPSAPFSIAQGNSGKFWDILSSRAVSYTMACVAEINFNVVRFTALDAIWKSAKNSPQGAQARNHDWTLTALQNHLAFDDEDETLEFCQAFDLAFKNNDSGEQCLDFTAGSQASLDKSSIPSKQIFSHGVVEDKRHRRTLVAVINGIGVASAIRQGLVIDSSPPEDDESRRDNNTVADNDDDDQSMFIPEQGVGDRRATPSAFGSALNPSASSFVPSPVFGEPVASNQVQRSGFGRHIENLASDSPDGRVIGSNELSFTSNQASPVVQIGGGPVPQSPSFGRTPPDPNSIFGHSVMSSQRPFTPFGQPATTQSAAETKTASSSLSSVFGQTVQQTQPQGPKPDLFGGFPVSQTVKQAPSSIPTFGQNVSSQPSITSNALSDPLQQSNKLYQNWGQQHTPVENKDARDPPLGAPAPGSELEKVGPTTDKDASAQAKISPITTFSSQRSTADLKAQPGFSFMSPPSPSKKPSGSEPLFTDSSSSKSTSSLLPSTTQSLQSQPDPSPPFGQTSQSFKFTAPAAQTQAQNSTPLPAFEPSTTPQGTPKRPQLGQYRFPSVSETRGNLVDPKGFNLSLDRVEAEQKQQTPSRSSPQSIDSTRSLPQSAQQPTEPLFTEADRSRLIDNTARIILTQPQGLIEYCVSHHVSNLLQILVKQFLQDQEDQVMTKIRTRHLSRKFFGFWHERTQRIALNKRAKQRRKLLAAAMKAEQDRKQRNEAELEAILAVTQETKRIQEEQQKLSQQSKKQKLTIPDDNQHKDSHVQAAGQKRKTSATNYSPRSSQATPQWARPSHKRSRTIGTVSEPSASMRLSTSNSASRTSTANFGASRLGLSLTDRATNSSNSRKSLARKVDSTRTDYFKLKAMGLDPGTPLIPDTAKTLRSRKNMEQETREALLSKSRMRPSAFSLSTTSRQSSPVVQSPPETNLSRQQTSIPHSTRASETANSNPVAEFEEDGFLRQLREARQSLAQDESWFKAQTSVLEKEIEQQEEFRKSQTSQTSIRNTSPQVSTKGLATVRGYEYYPAETDSGKSMSRTEERIRRTGAHGLATRPIGSQYVPVAMSRQSALRFSQSVKANSSQTGQHVSGEPGDFYGSKNSSNKPKTPPTITKKTNETSWSQGGRHNAVLTKVSFNALSALQNHNMGNDAEDEQAEDDRIEAQENYYLQNGAHYGDIEDNDEDEEVLEDDEEDLEEEEEEGEEEEELEDELQHDTAHHYAILGKIPSEERVYDDDDDEEEDEGDEDDDGTPGTHPQFSRAHSSRSSTGALSGPGATADDALVLSD